MLCLLISAALGWLVCANAQASEVAVDVGHTLAASGAVSARGGREFDFNRVLATRVAAALGERTLSVRPITFDGRIASLEARPEQAAGADFFISIHHDSVRPEFLEEWRWQGALQTYSDRHRGFSLFVSRDNPDLATSLRCASAIGARLRRLGFVGATHHADSLTGQARPYADADNAVHYYDNLIVLYRINEAGRIAIPAATNSASCPAHDIWKNIFCCRFSTISRSSVRRERYISR